MNIDWDTHEEEYRTTTHNVHEPTTYEIAEMELKAQEQQFIRSYFE